MTQFEKLPRSLARHSPPPVQLREEELDLFAIFRLIRRRIPLIVVVAVCVVAAALPPILSMQRTYYAQSRLLLQRPLTTSLAAPPTDELGELDLDTELQRLLSRDIAVRVIEQFALESLPEFNPSLRPVPALERARGAVRGWIDGGTGEPPAETDPLEQVIGAYFGALSVYRNGQSQVVEIGFLSLDPELAADVANALVRIYLDEREEKLRARVTAAESWFAARAAEQRQRLDAANREIKEFRDASGLASDATESATSTTAALSARRAELASERAGIAARLAGIEAANRGAEAADLVDTLAMGDLRRELQLQLHALSKLLVTYGDAHATVVAARARVSDAEAAVAAEVARSVQALHGELAALDREDTAVRERLEAARASLGQLELAESGLETLLSRAQREQEGFYELERQRRTLQSQLELPAAEVEVLSPAAVPLYPQGRGRVVYLLAAMVAAGGLALTAAVFRELLDRGVRSSQQLGGIGGIFAAAMLPRVSLRAPNLPDVVRLQPDGMFADSIRGLALALERAGSGKMPQSIMVTSALPGDGKSLIAASLAIELAAAGRRVLLVDGDLRRGKVHGFFGGAAEPGLADVLCGDRDLADVVRHDDQTGVDYVPRGCLRAVPYHEHQHVSRLIQHAKENGQIVVVDSAPVLATTGTSVLAGIADRTVLVVRWGRTNRRTVELAVQRLLASSRDDVAVAINMVNPRRHVLYGFTDAGLFSPELRKYYPRSI